MHRNKDVKNSGRRLMGTIDHRFDVYEVAPTVPGPNDKLRDQEVSSAIAQWKKTNSLAAKARQ
ncbi:hypothetical protein [Paenibacillus nasutitermitis]|uniref:Uncharacterized protein n=1 Tax=Paenibacillus nasutitermitis TaxID=1652958 RepID=A0A916ZG72_9BACL|nr:hypothetical protein [Paenibacillus nasutitermitis]GGD95281.1 hypothetical protein GCM10010911_62490 [Paenibacillus nasutitermitis]